MIEKEGGGEGGEGGEEAVGKTTRRTGRGRKVVAGSEKELN